ncbi:MAG: IS4 family transposase [Planctomycetota bacterium]
MRDCNQGRFGQQIRFLRRQFLQDGELPFCDVLSVQIVQQALTAADVVWNDRIYTPMVTLWVFLSQVLSADHSCRSAVARLIAHRMSRGLRPCSPESGAYCQARKRLPEKFFSMVACHVGRELDSQANSDWLWKGRRVYMFDGTTVTMPDTPANQKAYPQIPSQRPGLGSPITRIGAIVSLSCGAIIGLGFRRFAGKGQSELSLLHELWDLFAPGDVMLGDRLMCSWREMVMLKLRGVDIVTRICRRTADFRRGKRLGKGDHIVLWPKPYNRTPDKAAYKALPDYFAFRETRVHVKQQGFRTKTIIVVTTMLDAEQTTKEDIAFLYLARWNNELDFRSIKSTMQMDDLRCKTPELVRKEVWTHVLAYNLIRTIIAQAASRHSVEPRSISFKGTLQTLEAFQTVLAIRNRCDSIFRRELYQQLLDCIAAHRVANRPNRFEPRKRKRRFKLYNFLRKSRQETKLDMMKRVRKN